jgi:hypothetical protein
MRIYLSLSSLGSIRKVYKDFRGYSLNKNTFNYEHNEESQMEKGFNDDELADIMNEIESLEQEFAKSDDSFVDQEPNLDDVANSVIELAQSEEDHSLLSEVASMPVENITPSASNHDVDTDEHHNVSQNVHHIKHQENSMKHSSNKTAKTAMNFSVEGDMKLDLSFLVSGKEINLHISEDGFEIELEGGAKFSLPVHSGSQGSKAA